MRESRWIALGLLVATLAVFGQVLGHDFVDYDDVKHIVENPDVAGGFSLEAAAKVFVRPHFGERIPLTYVSLQIDRSLFGPGAAGTLGTNVALHAASALLLFGALRKLSGRTGPSAFVAAVFALHPLHVESVAWAFERKDVLSGFFFMLALWCYARFAEAPGAARRIGPVAFALAASLLSKPMAVTLPFVLLLLDHWPLGRFGSGQAGFEPARVGALVREKWPLFAIVALVVAWTLSAHGGASVPEATRVPFELRVWKALDAYAFYFLKSFWPVGLAVYYPHPFDAAPLARALAAGLGLLGLSGLALWQARRRPYLAVGWFWFVGMLVPVIGLVQLGLHHVADRYAYLPQTGLAIALAWGIDDALGARPAARRAIVAVALAAIGLLAFGAWRQVGHWRDTRSLFERAIAVTDDNFLAHWRLGVAHARESRYEPALFHLRESVRIFPELAIPQAELAQTLEAAGEFEAAFVHYRRALEIEPDAPGTRARFGLALLGRGRTQEARAQLEHALAGDANHARAQAGLGQLRADAGEERAALEHYRRALALEPGYLPAVNNLALLLATGRDSGLRDPEAAIRLVESASRSLPEAEPALLDTLGAAYFAAGQVERAREVASHAAEVARAQGRHELAAEIRANLARYRDD